MDDYDHEDEDQTPRVMSGASDAPAQTLAPDSESNVSLHTVVDVDAEEGGDEDGDEHEGTAPAQTVHMDDAEVCRFSVLLAECSPVAPSFSALILALSTLTLCRRCRVAPSFSALVLALSTLTVCRRCPVAQSFSALVLALSTLTICRR